MTIEIKHKFVSPKVDGPDTTRVRPSNWNDTHDLIMAANRIMGRTTAGAGAAEEISVGGNLSLSAGVLDLSSTYSAAVAADITALEGVNTARRLAMPLADTDNSHSANLKLGSNLTADRDLTIIMNDANTTLNIPALVAGTPAMVFLGDVAASTVSSVDFTGLSASYDEFIILVQNLFMSSATSLILTVSTNNGSSFLNSGYSYQRLTVNSTTVSAQTISAQSSMQMSDSVGTSVSNGVSGEIRLFTGNANVLKAQAFLGDGNGFGVRMGQVGLSGTKVNAVKISGNPMTGSFKLYGVKNS